MNKEQRKITAIIVGAFGGLLLIVGLLLGFMPITKQGVSCGSAFNPSDEGFVHDLTHAMEADASGAAYYPTSYASDCEDATSSRKTFAWVALAPGIICALGGLVLGASTFDPNEKRPDAAQAEPAGTDGRS